MKPSRAVWLLLILLVFSAAPDVRAEVKLPTIIGDHMVLQREKPLPIWGWDEPGAEVTVMLGDAKKSAKAGDDGKWMVELPAMKAGGPHTLSIAGSSKVELKDILIGEVWLCSGQSNMEWPVAASNDAQEEIAAADHPRIRHIKINHVPAAEPQADAKGGPWQVCSKDTVANFTAAGYFFGRELEKELDVPIGLIGSNWGGTRIEPWVPPVGFKETPALKDIADNLDKFPQQDANGNVNHQTPLALYNGMIAPLVPYAIRGAIWYQGESNNGEGMKYHEKMKALIGGWRSIWKNSEMPFYFVQLAPYNYGGDGTRLAEIWAAQAATLKLPHTGMAATVDIGDVKDIHPKNKQDVGKRLALCALHDAYGKKDIVYSGPMFKGMQVEEDKVRVTFDHVGGGLVSRDDKPLTWFQVAGEDGKFVDAKAEIVDDAVIVSADSVPKPVSVRFAWDHAAEPNLSNKAGLPASPFKAEK